MNVKTAQHPKKRKSEKVVYNINHFDFVPFINGLQWFFNRQEKELTIGNKMVLISILSLFEQKEVITKQDVIRANKAVGSTVYMNMKLLERKGFIESTRSNQFYSLSYITLTDKGNLFASRLRRILQGT